MSLPTWGRGLKYKSKPHAIHSPRVAPYLGAWIEIPVDGSTTVRKAVAPYLGAWIEIISFSFACISLCVAPYLGAWIEMRRQGRSGQALKSLPTWGRGLKSNVQSINFYS